MAEVSPIGQVFGRQVEKPAATQPAAEVVEETKAAGETPAAKATETVAGGNVETDKKPEAVKSDDAGLKSALEKERTERKRHERDARSMRAQIDEQNKRFAEMEKRLAPKPEDLDAKFFDGSPAKFIGEQIQSQMKSAHEAAERRFYLSNMELARRQFPDFEDAREAFVDAASKTPAMWNDIANSPAPAYAMYDAGKKLSAGSGESQEQLVARLVADGIEKAMAGRDGGQAAEVETTAVVERKSVPKSTIGARGTSVGKTAQWSGPTPISKIFGRHRRAAG